MEFALYRWIINKFENINKLLISQYIQLKGSLQTGVVQHFGSINFIPIILFLIYNNYVALKVSGKRQTSLHHRKWILICKAALAF